MKSKNHKRGPKGSIRLAFAESGAAGYYRRHRHLLVSVDEPLRVLAVSNDLAALGVRRRGLDRIGAKTRLARHGDDATALCEGRPMGVAWEE